jgi:hypothetical protein
VPVAEKHPSVSIFRAVEWAERFSPALIPSKRPEAKKSALPSISTFCGNHARREFHRKVLRDTVAGTPASNDKQPLMYTIGTAAKATGKTKSTISRDIHKGKISATKNEDGSYSIDPAELHRVYPPVSQGNGSSNGQSNDSQPLNFDAGTGGLAVELQQLRERLSSVELERDREREQLTDQIEDLRRRLDRADEERRDKDRQLTALLTDQRPKLEPAPQPKGIRGFLHRLTG